MMNKLAGSVVLDGKISYTGLTPRFNAHGLDVYRLRDAGNTSLIETEGPHIFLQLPQLLMMSIPAQSLAKGAKYLFVGPGIGSIRMLYGYPAADLGSETRYIEEYSLLVTSQSNTLTIYIEGWAGPIDEQTKHRNKVYASRQDFQIEFVLPEALFEEVIEQKSGLDTLRQLMKRAGNA